ncbi:MULTISPECIES: hypothetical protein [Acinetobacter]|uniref:Uncharacterized protein n=1 Tax=Acinetobacter higginsii TaxID=70347 RepID=N9T5V6_9GAMM|nr:MULTISPECIES: hypothetical protein [Acinetobacter]ENX58805.1 hypothetical protein F902_01432 [Acinetobacter higginsii]
MTEELKKYEDFTILSEYVQDLGTRKQKICWITDGLAEYQVICGLEEDPILIWLEANQ